MEQIAKLSLSLAPAKGETCSSAQVAAFGPMLQGFLMEQISPDYAGVLHAMTFNPYSQFCEITENGEIVWSIGALTSEAVERIVDPLSRIEAVSLKANGRTFEVKSKKMESMGIDRLLDVMKDECEPRHRIKFVTPTAFKTHGEYAIMPTTRLVFQNLLMHYGQVYSGSNEIEEETLTYIADNTKVTSYSLRSRCFAHSMREKSRIPAFVGDMTLNVSGSQPMQGLINMLLRFGEFAGVGIKTSMGMGGMRLL